MKNLWHRLLLSGAGNRITKDPAVQGEPQARGDRIVRIDTRSNPGYDPDPYFYYPALDLPTPIGKPVTTRGWARYDGAKLTPGFTSNATGGSSPPAVNFTGLTPGNLTGRFRDFGEAMSQVRKPARTYPRPGSCMTSLTVPNAPGSSTLSRSGCITVTQGIIPLPGFAGPPAVPDSDGKHLDLTGDGRAGWNDVVVIFTKTGWISTNEPVTASHMNGNGWTVFSDFIVSGVVNRNDTQACPIAHDRTGHRCIPRVCSIGICRHRARCRSKGR